MSTDTSDLGALATSAVHLVVALGAVLVVPLGLRLLGSRTVPRPTSAAWPLAGLAAAVAVWLPVGAAAALVALPWAVAGAVLLGAGVRALVRPDTPATRRVAVATALAMPAVGAAALVAERAGWGLLGFSGTYLTLTVPHMLFAGFGACLVAGLVGGAVPGRLADVAATAVPVGVLLVLGGYFVGDAAELAGAVVLTGALWCAATAVLRPDPRGTGADPRTDDSRRARHLLRLGAVAVVVAMVLALWWAVGEVLDVSHPSLDVMVASHGVLNSLGFVVCTIVGFRMLRPAALGSPGPGSAGSAVREAAPPTADGLTYTEVGATLRGTHPSGYRRTHGRWLVADRTTPEDATALGEALLSWRVHAEAGMRVDAGRPATSGSRVVSRPGVGPVRLTAPCIVVGVLRSPERTGFAYGTLAGHPFRGEELFTVERDATGRLWFTIDAFSLPARWWARAAGPLPGLGQRAYGLLLARAARRLHRRAGADRTRPTDDVAEAEVSRPADRRR